MAIEIFVARIIAIMYFVIGIAGLMDKKYYLNTMQEIMKNSGIRLVFGMLGMIVSFIIVFYHNVWTGWPILITLIGWIGLIKSINMILFPKFLERKSNFVFKGGFAKVMPYICIILALIFGYFGFLA